MLTISVPEICLQVALVVVIYTQCFSTVAAVHLKVQYKVENDLTCYTCTNKSDNLACNKWAPEKFCPLDHTVCASVHRFDTYSGRSVIVNKLCTLPSRCTYKHVGCSHIDGTNEMECVSCCIVSYCNKGVAVDVYTALKLSNSLVPLNAVSASGAAWSSSVVKWLIAIAAIGLIGTAAASSAA